MLGGEEARFFRSELILESTPTQKRCLTWRETLTVKTDSTGEGWGGMVRLVALAMVSARRRFPLRALYFSSCFIW